MLRAIRCKSHATDQTVDPAPQRGPWPLAAAAAGLLIGGATFSPLAAQSTGWHGNPELRPVPKVRSSSLASGNHQAAQGNTPTQRPGWNLRWRTSPQMAAEKARQISDAAFAQEPAQQPVAHAVTPHRDTPANRDTANRGTPAIVATATTLPHRATAATAQPNQLRQEASSNVQQVAWATPQSGQSNGGMALPENLYRGQSAAPSNADPTNAAPLSAAPPQPTGPALQAPNRAIAEELPVPESAPKSAPGPAQSPSQAPPNAAPGSVPNDNLEELFGFDPATNPRSAGPNSNPPQPSADGSSIRDMLQGDAAEPSTLGPASGQPRNLQELPPGIPSEELEDSPSDLETFAPNPFDNREAGNASDSARDSRDRERLEGGTPEIFGAEDEGPTNSGTGLSCDDFRERIRAATIDQVSLDPSPPFRPDVINMQEFDKLKDKFNSNQQVRTWRSIDGRPLGSGRLNDLAYEKAVIETEFGTKEDLPLNQLSEADLAYISQNWGLPTECLIEQVAYTPRQWTPTTMTYTASNLCHKPLYFEEVNLERYGHTAGPLAQPVISSAHFFLNIAVLPYKMGVHSPHECQYALGYYRPGNCAPWIIPPVPLSVKGAWYQAAAVTGTALLVP
ncbi:hypothetical protein CA85_19500 [Allorhodopirellula solitaria]|uniref:Uncharacterized protein n=1 Tax=Allorhodopirellula solitaria TaxID=2527987 RepID=A0A5C5XW21_9BACT|nr:hypothetical protein CA85_19500 [Allorhodopirellula solitaria]